LKLEGEQEQEQEPVPVQVLEREQVLEPALGQAHEQGQPV